MTRDIQGLHSHAHNNDGILPALWATAPFPRLPIDAPKELRKLVVDVDDPKRVYTIHHASRRHQFHSLVERYILQVRYGCQNESCTTPTCFSCRKRIANGAPIRRYNATSARALAVYLSSQDDPEVELCHSPSAKPPAHGTNKISGAPRKQDTEVNANEESSSPKLDPKEDSVITEGKIRNNRNGVVYDGNNKTNQSSFSKILEKPTTIDHKSFLQTVINTVAFKVVEWLAPGNFDEPTTSGNNLNTDADEDENCPPPPGKLENKQNGTKLEFKQNQVVDKVAGHVGSDHEDNDLPKEESEMADSPRSITSKSISSGDPILNGDGQDFSHTRSQEIPVPLRRSSSTLLAKIPTCSPQLPKEVISTSAIINNSDSKLDKKHLSRDRRPSQIVRRLSQKEILSSPKTETPPQISEPRTISTPTVQTEPIETADLAPKQTSIKATNDIHYMQDLQIMNQHKQNIPEPYEKIRLPQSLSHMTAEVMDLICNILQSDGTFERHFLHPPKIKDGFKHQQRNAVALARRPLYPKPSIYPHSLRSQWHLFIEQAVFDVFHKPESLLKSFCQNDEVLWDSQSIWYGMLLMTRATPSLVFHGLWVAVGAVFSPPEDFVYKAELSKEQISDVNHTSGAISDINAARIISICLHALVATAPVVLGERQLGNMSRIRSKGLVMDDLELPSLCLQYEDAFTNDLALRLARRVFRAIPTRQSFAESKRHQQAAYGNIDSDLDIIQTILETMRTPDLGTLSLFDFSDSESRLHEKRVSFLVLDWARTVLIHEWDGAAEIPSNGPSGGALAMIAALYKERKTLHLGDIHFQTDFLSDRLDSVEMPLEWFKFESNRKTTHLLDYPYLFHPMSLVTYFRAINYSRMNDAYETAKAKRGFMDWTTNTKYLVTDREIMVNLERNLALAISEFLVLKIRRTHILVDAFDSIWRRERRELMRPLKIRLFEEGTSDQAQDDGGVQQEFFRLAIAEALNPDSGLFTQDKRTKMTWFQSGSPEPLWRFELIGMLVSLAVYNGLTLPVTFPKALYRKLLDEEVSELHHIVDGWPDFERGLKAILEWDESDGTVEDTFGLTYEFTADQLGERLSREMGVSSRWPQFSDWDANVASNPSDAPPVTNENRNNYVSDFIHYLTDVSIQPQLAAFKSGFFACIDRRALGLFNADILQSVVEGIQTIDISEMRHVTDYNGWDSTHQSIKDFWSIVESYDNSRKRKLLEFVTASDRVPVGGMKNMVFIINKNGVGDERLPSSSTCYGVLMLPQYTSKEAMKKKLDMALDNTEGFGLP